MQAIYSDVRELGAELVVFSGETREVSAALAKRLNLTFPIFVDGALTVAKSFGLAFTLPDDLRALYQSFGIDLPKNTGHPEWALPMPARYVVDRTGIIRSAEVDPDYTVRPEPADTLARLRSIV